MEQSIKRNSFIIGLVGAIITMGIYLYMWQAQDYLNPLVNTSIYIYPIILGVVAQVWARFVMKGVVSFKQVVLAYFICIVMIFLTESITYYILLNYVDVGAKEILLNAWRGITEKGTSDLAQTKVFKEPTYSFSEFALGFATKTLMFTVPGLITGLVVSKIPQR
ncbi:hypothetical protein A9Q93_03700 [Nonlabens dokdonensis]|uniref:DUF4199 domain-containing protein n=1 Tax=Nonlabens dokdonensis TaxID=328515 RepID=A0A1Z8B7N5_9FLAO|nr:DUF4199 family protein [Nonlabens dokdonensis]OUS18595.1 hypothetical protein A9Q93_03700 [Nonlabens dokdonensis]